MVYKMHTSQTIPLVFQKLQMSSFIDNWSFDYTDYSVKMT